MPAGPILLRQDSYSFEKESSDGVTLITMHGTLNETFEARALAGSIRTNKLLINMADVRRFASWGMSEWMEFLRATAECDVYLVECSTYSVSQLNLVTGLLGHAKLVSFYASYRCGGCSEEMQTLFLIPRDRAMIPDIPNRHQDCRTCGGRARLEEYPAAFFDAIAARPAFDIDDEALAYMRTRLKYELSPDLSRFRAFRRAQKDHTYIRLTGNIATLPAETLARASAGATTTVVDLEQIVFDPTQLDPWHAYIHAAMPGVRSLQLMNCPPGFLEAAVLPTELRDKLKVRSFAVSYVCETCGTPTTQLVDVALNLEHLVVAAVPVAKCPSCRSALAMAVSEPMADVLRALPARDRDVELENFLTKARAEPVTKLENCLVTTTSKPMRGRRVPYIARALAVLLLGSLGFAAWKTTGHDDPVPKPQPAVHEPNVNSQPATFTRPDWITSDVPAAGYCHDMTNRLTCVGVSSYRTNREDGVADASDVALEELVSTVGLKITDPFFRDTVVPLYNEPRTKALSSLQGVNRASDAKGSAYSAADEAVRASRKRTVEVLRATGGAAVPVQRSDWYWEEYAGETNGATEFLVFVRFDVSPDAVRALVDKYSATTTAAGIGVSAMTAFPALAWQHTNFAGGAVLTKPGTRLSRAGLKPTDVIVAVGDQRVTDANSFVKKLADAHGDLKVTVSANDAEKIVDVRP